MRWFPHATVATVIHRDGQFLMVKEHTAQGIAYNQPAGHLEKDESLIDAAIRETLEETGWHVEITHLLAIHRFVAPEGGETYLRTTFIAQALHPKENATLDDGIIGAEWLSKEALIQKTCEPDVCRLRSDLVLHDIELFEAGVRFPLALLHDHPLHDHPLASGKID